MEWIGIYYTMDGEVPVMDVSFWFWQTEDETFTLGNGIYNVYLDATSGEILDIVYDSALAGNG